MDQSLAQVRRRVRRRVEHPQPPSAVKAVVVGSDPPDGLVAAADGCLNGDAVVVAADVASRQEWSRPPYIGVLCRRCYSRIRERLEQIDEIYPMLAEVLVPAPKTKARMAYAMYAPGSAPGRLDVMALTDRRAGPAQQPPSEHADPDEAPVYEVLSILGSWVARIDATRPQPELSANRRLIMNDLTTILRREQHWIAGQPWVDTFLGALELVQRELARATGAGMWPKPIGHCPNCQAPMEHHWETAMSATCRRCHTTWSGLALMRLRLIHEQEANG